MYTEKQFSNCVFNPLKEGKMLHNYPKLSGIIEPDWTADANLDMLIRYTIIVYDPASPLIIHEKDLNFRKSAAADLAGFDSLVDDVDFMDTIFNCTHPYMPALIVAYLTRFAKSKEWAALVVVENCFWESVKHLMDPISGDKSKVILEAVQKKSALKDELDKDISRLDKYQKAFFGGDEVMEEVFKRKSFSSPEKMLKSNV